MMDLQTTVQIQLLLTLDEVHPVMKTKQMIVDVGQN